MKRIDLRYPSEPRYVYDVRRLFQEFLRGAPLSADELEDLKVALSEACANAIAHGSPRGAGSHFSVHCRLMPDEFLPVARLARAAEGFVVKRVQEDEFRDGKGRGRNIAPRRQLGRQPEMLFADGARPGAQLLVGGFRTEMDLEVIIEDVSGAL